MVKRILLCLAAAIFGIASSENSGLRLLQTCSTGCNNASAGTSDPDSGNCQCTPGGGAYPPCPTTYCCNNCNECYPNDCSEVGPGTLFPNCVFPSDPSYSNCCAYQGYLC